MTTIIAPFVTADEVVDVLTLLAADGYPLATSTELASVFTGREGLNVAIRAARRQGRIRSQHVWTSDGPTQQITLTANEGHLNTARTR